MGKGERLQRILRRARVFKTHLSAAFFLYLRYSFHCSLRDAAPGRWAAPPLPTAPPASALRAELIEGSTATLLEDIGAVAESPAALEDTPESVLVERGGGPPAAPPPPFAKSPGSGSTTSSLGAPPPPPPLAAPAAAGRVRVEAAVTLFCRPCARARITASKSAMRCVVCACASKLSTSVTASARCGMGSLCTGSKPGSGGMRRACTLR